VCVIYEDEALRLDGVFDLYCDESDDIGTSDTFSDERDYDELRMYNVFNRRQRRNASAEYYMM